MPDADLKLCETADCLRPVRYRGSRCSAHAARLRKGGKTKGPIRERLPLRERIQHLCIGLADADSDDDRAYDRAWDTLRKAIEDWADELARERAGKTPQRQSRKRRQVSPDQFWFLFAQVSALESQAGTRRATGGG